jgi:uncharacterized protein YdhG (YjbR/CyaY superfamily)
MTSDAKSVDAFLENVPEQRLDALKRIRSLIRETHPAHEETMEYGMPSYRKDGAVELAFNSQRQYISLYLLKEGVLDAFRDRFPKSAMGKGCIRYRNPERIDFELMCEMLLAHAASGSLAC